MATSLSAALLVNPFLSGNSKRRPWTLLFPGRQVVDLLIPKFVLHFASTIGESEGETEEVLIVGDPAGVLASFRTPRGSVLKMFRLRQSDLAIASQPEFPDMRRSAPCRLYDCLKIKGRRSILWLSQGAASRVICDAEFTEAKRTELEIDHGEHVCLLLGVSPFKLSVKQVLRMPGSRT